MRPPFTDTQRGSGLLFTVGPGGGFLQGGAAVLWVTGPRGILLDLRDA